MKNPKKSKVRTQLVVSSGVLPNYRKIPKGAIKIVYPAIQQPDNYSCGAGALMAVAARLGVGPERIEEFKAALKTNAAHGTYYADICTYANHLGLDASVQIGVSKRRLKRLLDKQVSVIISFQAWADDASEYDDLDREENGHFAVADGYDDECVYFMDPSLHGRRGFLEWGEFQQRWHENEGSAKVERYSRLAIVIRPKGHQPVYDMLARHID